METQTKPKTPAGKPEEAKVHNTTLKVIPFAQIVFFFLLSIPGTILDILTLFRRRNLLRNLRPHLVNPRRLRYMRSFFI